MKRNGIYWTDAEKAALQAATSFSDLAAIALVVLARMPKPIRQVCGPISTGGLGSIEANVARFDATITMLIEDGYNVFDQIPFEEHIIRIPGRDWDRELNIRLLEEFYLPIFQSGHISILCFIPGWESSDGASWEHERGPEFGMEIQYLDHLR